MQKKKILIIDDEEDMCRLLKIHFENEGFHVDVASDEEGFRQKAFSLRPDLIILDIHLGAEKGPQIYRRLLSRGFDREVPVIFLTSLLEEGAQDPIKRGRIHALYRKPVDVKKLIEEIKTNIFALS